MNTANGVEMMLKGENLILRKLLVAACIANIAHAASHCCC